MASINRRRWKTKAGVTKNGWEVVWRTPKGKRRRKLFSGPGARDKAIAERNRRQLEEAAPAMSGHAETVAAAGKLWIAGLRQEGRAANTIGHYVYHLEQHIDPVPILRPGTREKVAFGSIPLKGADGLTTPDCVALKSALLDTLTPRLAQVAMGHVRMLLNDATRRGLIGHNPAQVVRVQLVDHGEGQVEIPTKAELRQILEAARQMSSVTGFAEVWSTLALFAGPRPQELRAFAIEDLVLEGLRPGLHVRRAADERSLKAVKRRHSRRFLPLGRAALAVMKAWLEVMPKSPPIPDPFDVTKTIRLLLPTSAGTLWSRGNLYRDFWVPLMRRAGLATAMHCDGRPATPVEVDAWERLSYREQQARRTIRWQLHYEMNCMRHAAASLMIEEGLSPKVIATRMGHSSVKVTYDLYGHLFRDRESDSAAAEAIERRLLG